MKKIITAIFILLSVCVVIQVKANTSSDEIYDYLNNSSSTLLDSNLFTQKDDKTLYQQPAEIRAERDKNYHLAIQNDKLALYVNEEGYSIAVENLETGYIWASEPLNGELSRSFRERSKSAFTLSVLDERDRLFEDKNIFDLRRIEKDYISDDEQDIVTFQLDLKDYEIRLTYSIALKDNTLEFSLTRDSIEEYGQNRLIKISFFEFLGAAHTNQIPGYNFIPSGPGALVRYTENANIKEPYKARFFNTDLYYSINENNLGLNYPVYGTVHGIDQNAFFVNILKGAEFAEFNYNPTGKGTKYHYQTTTFIYRDSYMQAILGSDQSKKIYDTNLKNYDIKYDISFLSGSDANYVGMAKQYKKVLVENNILTKATNSQELGIHLDVLGSDFEEGIFFNKTHKMTTVHDLLNMNDELSSNNVNPIFYTLRGFNTGGNTKSSYTNYSFNKALGDFHDLKNLDVTYYYNPVVSFQSKIGAPKTTLQTITKGYAGVEILNGDYYMYYTDIEEILNEFPKATESINRYGGMALDGLSNHLYTNKNTVRTDMMETYKQLIKEPIPMYRPNFVMLGQTSKYLNMPLVHERLRFFTDTVPFLPIVLSGYLPYYSDYLNFSANMNLDVLKVIDYGANPAFLITKQPSHLLSKTLSREYYGSYYGNLNQYIIDNDQFVKTALEPVLGEEIISREVLDEGIVQTGYANGIQIIINYSREDYVYHGNTIQKMNYLVLGS